MTQLTSRIWPSSTLPKLLLAALLTLPMSQAQAEVTTDVPELTAIQAETAPTIDGVLDDVVWSMAEVGSNFTQTQPNDGELAEFQTKFQVAYDSANLYVAILAEDPEPDKIMDRIHRRDQDSQSDWLVVAVDGYHDHRTGRFFGANAGGIQQDGSIAADFRFDTTWDGVWESAVKINEQGWVLEMRIPLNAIRFAEGQDNQWGLQIWRFVGRTNEDSNWSYIPASENRYISLAGHLDDIDITEAPLRLSLLPYATGIGLIDSDGEGNYSKDSSWRAGVDLRYGITPQMTLDLTLLPDFGQVEVDDLQINLGAFELFFTEKRPFFTEGADVFSTELDLNDGGNTNFFYSRRIGARGANILTAAKLTGRTDSGLSVGIIEAVTQEVVYEEEDELGNPVEYLESPTTNYGVARLRQDVGDHSAVGGMVTAVNRNTEGFHDAYAGLLDAVVADPSGVYTFEAMTGATAIQLDGESTTGTTGNFALNKGSGEHWVASIVYGWSTKDLEVNDLGFANEVNRHGGFAWLQLRDLDGLGPFRQVRWNNNASFSQLIDPSLLRNLDFNGNFWTQLNNFSGLAMGYGAESKANNPYEPRFGGFDYYFQTPGSKWFWAEYWSDDRKAFNYGLSVSASQNTFDSRSVNASPWAQVRVGKRAEFALSASARTVKGGIGWADYYDADMNGEIDSSVFGKRDYFQVDISHQGMVAFTKDLSLQYFAQYLAIQGQHSDYFLLADDGTLTTENFYYTSDGNADARLSNQFFQGNVRLRWQYRPGSEAFLVWTHERYGGPVEDSNIPTVLAHPFTGGHGNTLALKVTYRWGVEDKRPNFLSRFRNTSDIASPVEEG